MIAGWLIDAAVKAIRLTVEVRRSPYFYFRVMIADYDPEELVSWWLHVRFKRYSGFTPLPKKIGEFEWGVRLVLPPAVTP